MIYRSIYTALFLLLATLSYAEPYSEGKHYRLLPEPVATVDSQRVEVVEVFWYGCRHCYRFSTRMGEWVKRLPDDVSFVRLPAVWHPKMAVHAQAYFTAEALSVVREVHSRMFDGIHAKGMKLNSAREVRQLFEAAGVDGDEFSSVFDSFGVRSKVLRAEQRTRDYLVTGTPCIVVNGKYLITVESAGDREAMLKVADYLVKKER